MKWLGSLEWNRVRCWGGKQGPGPGKGPGKGQEGRAEAAGPQLLAPPLGEAFRASLLLQPEPSKRTAPCKLCGRLLVPWNLGFPAALPLSRVFFLVPGQLG